MADPLWEIKPEEANAEHRRNVLVQGFGWTSVIGGVFAIHSVLQTSAALLQKRGRLSPSEWVVFVFFEAFFMVGPFLLLTSGTKLIRRQRNAPRASVLAATASFAFNGLVGIALTTVSILQALHYGSFGFAPAKGILTWFPVTHLLIHCVYAPTLGIAMMLPWANRVCRN